MLALRMRREVMMLNRRELLTGAAACVTYAALTKRADAALLGARGIAFGGGGAAPLPYDREVAYLASDQAYVTIPNGGKAFTSLNCDCEFPATFSAYKGVYGNYVGENNNCERFLWSDRSSTVYMNNGGAAKNTLWFGGFGGKRATIRILGSTITVNNESKGGGTDAAGTANNNNVVLFRPSAGTSQMATAIKIYAFSAAWDGGSVDLIPVVKNNVGYFYDRVSKTLKGAEGLGSFTWGELTP